MNTVKVEGKNKKNKVFLYTLSTCGWCKMTKQYLKDNDTAYEYLDVDRSSRRPSRTLNAETPPWPSRLLSSTTRPSYPDSRRTQ